MNQRNRKYSIITKLVCVVCLMLFSGCLVGFGFGDDVKLKDTEPIIDLDKYLVDSAPFWDTGDTDEDTLEEEAEEDREIPLEVVSEIYVRVTNKRIYVNRVWCRDIDTMIHELDRIYERGKTVVLVDYYAEYDTCRAVLARLSEDKFSPAYELVSSAEELENVTGGLLSEKSD